MTHMPPLFGAVEDAAFGAKQKVGYQYSTMPRVIHEAEKVRDRKTINIMLWSVYYGFGNTLNDLEAVKSKFVVIDWILGKIL